MAVDAERPQPVGRRPQDEPKPGPAWAGRLVADRHGRDRIQSLLWLPGRRPALAGPEQRQGARRCRARTPIRAAPGSGTTRRRSSVSATRLTAPSPSAASTPCRSTRSIPTIRWAAPTPSRPWASRAPTPASATPRPRAPILPSSTGWKSPIPHSTERISASAAWCNGEVTTRATAPAASIRARPAPTSTCFRDTPYGGVLSMDFIGSWAKDVVNVGTFTGSCTQITKGPFAGQATCTSGIPNGYNNTDVTGDAVEQHRLSVRPPSTRCKP